VFAFFTKPVPLAKMPLLRPVTGDFDQALGYTFFGYLFLRNEKTGEYAIYLATTTELEETGQMDETGFREQILGNSGVIETMLRPRDIETLTERLGALGENEVFFPVPLPAMGGSNELATFEKGGLWEFISLNRQTR
jgi:hypothetical protein